MIDCDCVCCGATVAPEVAEAPEPLPDPSRLQRGRLAIAASISTGLMADLGRTITPADVSFHKALAALAKPEAADWTQSVKGLTLR